MGEWYDERLNMDRLDALQITSVALLTTQSFWYQTVDFPANMAFCQEWKWCLIGQNHICASIFLNFHHDVRWCKQGLCRRFTRKLLEDIGWSCQMFLTWGKVHDILVLRFNALGKRCTYIYMYVDISIYSIFIKKFKQKMQLHNSACC